MELNETVYLSTAADDLDRLTRLQQIRTGLENAMLANVGNEPITEYSLDDGQTKIRTVYRSIKAQTEALEIIERQINRLINRLNGNQMVLRSWQGLRR